MSLVAVPFAILWPAAIVIALLDGRRRAVGWSSVAVLAAVLLVLTVLTVRAAGGNREEAAEMLGIGERTLYRRLRELEGR